MSAQADAGSEGDSGSECDPSGGDCDPDGEIDAGRVRRDAGRRVDASQLGEDASISVADAGEAADAGAPAIDGGSDLVDASQAGEDASVPLDASRQPFVSQCAAPQSPGPLPDPLPPELSPLTYQGPPFGDLHQIPPEGPGWHFVGNCSGLPIDAYNIVAYILTELALYCPGSPGTDPKAIIQDASWEGCSGHPQGCHQRNDVDISYYTCGPYNLTQGTYGTNIPIAIWTFGPNNGLILDPTLFDARRVYWLWRRLEETHVTTTQIDNEIALAIRDWALAHIGPNAMAPTGGDGEDMRGAWAHHVHMHVRLTESIDETSTYVWSFFTDAARAARAAEYARW
ncbi:MAG: hypothetical protein HY901_38670 [Deltaproteobacteria bacterium]|nr:hypothetical protein [Deltaproteobacteria bacterium]